jgi:tetratricopeptide (TPR) repeat protein
LAWNSRSASERERSTAEAVAHSDNVSWKEKLYIGAMRNLMSGNPELAVLEIEKIVERYPEEKEAFFWMGHNYSVEMGRSEESIPYYQRAIEIDPLDKTVYNEMAYAYDRLGDFEKSLWAINKYIDLAPDEANPYDTRGDLYANNGDLDQAIGSYQKSLTIKPDFYDSMEKLGHLYVFRGDYAGAESWFQELTSCPQAYWRAVGRTHLACIPIRQGRFEAALEILDQGIAADRMEQRELMNYGLKHYLKADIYVETGSYDLALKEFEVAMEIFRDVGYNPPVYARDYYVYILAEKGDIERAEEVTQAIKKDLEGSDGFSMRSYWYAAGCVAFAKGDYGASVAALEEAAKNTERFWEHYLLGKAYLESGQLGEAVASFEGVLGRYGQSRTYAPVIAVRAHYLLALAYEQSGWNNRAIEQYEEFLDIWKDADPGIPEIEDARARLTRLRRGA